MNKWKRGNKVSHVQMRSQSSDMRGPHQDESSVGTLIPPNVGNSNCFQQRMSLYTSGGQMNLEGPPDEKVRELEERISELADLKDE